MNHTHKAWSRRVAAPGSTSVAAGGRSPAAPASSPVRPGVHSSLLLSVSPLEKWGGNLCLLPGWAQTLGGKHPKSGPLREEAEGMCR